MEESFRKDLTHLTWNEVYARQEKRGFLVDAWMDALRLKPGDRVLEVGAGPGYVSMPTDWSTPLTSQPRPWPTWSTFKKSAASRKSGESLPMLLRWCPRIFPFTRR